MSNSNLPSPQEIPSKDLIKLIRDMQTIAFKHSQHPMGELSQKRIIGLLEEVEVRLQRLDLVATALASASSLLLSVKLSPAYGLGDIGEILATRHYKEAMDQLNQFEENHQ
jgi:hypothetical protein